MPSADMNTGCAGGICVVILLVSQRPPGCAVMDPQSYTCLERVSGEFADSIQQERYSGALDNNKLTSLHRSVVDEEVMG